MSSFSGFVAIFIFSLGLNDNAVLDLRLVPKCRLTATLLLKPSNYSSIGDIVA
jgi:hypothetical protein